MSPPLTRPLLRERAATLRTGVRRAVLRRRRLLAALAAGAAVLAGLQAVAPPPPPTVAVLTFARDLPSGAVLTTADLVEVRVPEEVAPAGASSRAAAAGRTLAAPVRRGEAVTDVRLVSGGLLRGYPGKVAVPVRIPDAGAVALARVGDRVDVLSADPSAPAARAETVAEDAPVIAVPTPDAAGATGAAGGLAGRLVVLALAPDQAEVLAAHAARSYLSVTFSG